MILKSLVPSSIYLDENFYPKINLFNLVSNDYVNMANYTNNDTSYLYFTAPELFHEFHYDQSVDAYSFSMIAYLILTSKFPFCEISGRFFELVRKIQDGYRPSIDSSISKGFKKLIESCWSGKPSNRPNFEQIVELLSNPDFINESMDINIDEFNEYIKFVKTGFKKSGGKFEGNKDHQIDFSMPISLEISSLDLSKFQLVKKIGFGISGDVYQAVNKETGKIYAAKLYSSLISEDTINSKESLNFLRELEILSKIKHPTILKFIGCSPINFQVECKPVIITELLANNSLESILEIERKGHKIPNWNETRKFIFIYGIAFAMNYLHSNNILHRDIKPGNILIDDYLFPKICDFGFSNVIENKSNEIIGTPAFMAPEIYLECEYSEASDVYAYAMLVYEMMELKLPFQGLSPAQIAYNLCQLDNRPKLTKKTPKKYKELIRSCWNRDPSKRPTFQNIIENLLKTDSGFKFENFDEELFNQYIQFKRKRNQSI